MAVKFNGRQDQYILTCRTTVTNEATELLDITDIKKKTVTSIPLKTKTSGIPDIKNLLTS